MGFRSTPALSFILNVYLPLFDGGENEERTSMHNMWEAFEGGGEVRMALGEYPQSLLYGWVEDRFGVNWQLTLTAPADDPLPLLIPQFMFTGPVTQARQAIELYTGLTRIQAPECSYPSRGNRAPSTSPSSILLDYGSPPWMVARPTSSPSHQDSRRKPPSRTRLRTTNCGSRYLRCQRPNDAAGLSAGLVSAGKSCRRI